MADGSILVINAGSSSLKLGIYQRADGDERPVLDGAADGIAQSGGTVELKDGEGRKLRSEAMANGTQEAALRTLVRWTAEAGQGAPLAIGHRVVHGGPRLTEHAMITPELMAELNASVHFAPLHIPPAISLIEAAGRAFPAVPQFACFDTAFHRTMPEAAARFALPRELYEHGIRRYGFHGLSYESIVHEMGADLRGRTVMAHLGGGASLAAVREGRSVDTTMGLTPTGGIPMGTRSGDLDPGVLLFLEQARGMGTDAVEAMLNHESGLRALSGGKSDMREIEAAAAAGDGEAGLAVEVFCGAIAKTVAAYATVLGGLEMLLFAGGIGEHSARVRAEVCGRLGFLGLRMDEAANGAGGGGRISAEGSGVEVRVVRSDEDRQIARHCRGLMAQQG